MRLLRMTIGRWLIHAGLKALPQGRCREEIERLLQMWAFGVYMELEAAK